MVFVPYLTLLDLDGLKKRELASLEKRIQAELAATKLKANDLEKMLEKIQDHKAKTSKKK